MNKVQVFSSALVVVASLTLQGASANPISPDDWNASNPTAITTWSFTWVHPVTDHTSTYHVVEKALDFYAAEDQCSLMYGGHLVAPSTELEDDHMKIQLLNRYGVEFANFIIGLIHDEAGWRYLNGETYLYSDWFKNEPNGGVGASGLVRANKNWQWIDVEVFETYWFICEV